VGGEVGSDIVLPSGRAGAAVSRVLVAPSLQRQGRRVTSVTGPETLETTRLRQRSPPETGGDETAAHPKTPTKDASMGLQERRLMKDLQDRVLPERSREIAEICGAEIGYDVDWSSLENDAQALNFLDNLACHRLNMALRTICIDELGREAVRDGLKQVRLHNVATPEQRRITFSDGVLEMHTAFAHGASGMHSDGDIRQVLLAGL
jgi:hypothetical protein